MAETSDKFTPGVQRVLVQAEGEARRYSQSCIAAEHLLLAVIDERDSTGARVLRRFNVEADSVRAAIEKLSRHHAVSDNAQPELSARAKHVLDLTLDEARLHQHNRAGTGHLLLGLIRENEGIPAGVLASMGVGVHNVEQVREHVIAVDRPALL